MDDVTSVTFIGDELSAAGFRLAGARTLTPEKSETAKVLAGARQDCEMLLITAEYAREIPNRLLEQALANGKPLMLIVPDVLRQFQAPDLVRVVDRALGIES